MLLCGGAWAPGDEPAPTERGVAQLLAFERLPFLKSDVKVEYLGSMDKTGGNWDNWWELYTDANGEHVVFEAEGPGCIYSFLSFLSDDTIFKFYFDGETEPRAVLKSEPGKAHKQSEFGTKAPFLFPLAEDWRKVPGTIANVRRIWLPMAFRKSCRITSTAQHTSPPNGMGYGGIEYQTYTTAEGVETFDPKADYSALMTMFNRAGKDPKSTTGNQTVKGDLELVAGQSKTIYGARARDRSRRSCWISSRSACRSSATRGFASFGKASSRRRSSAQRGRCSATRWSRTTSL